MLFLLLAVLFTWPLAVRLGTHLPGTGYDDNVLFLWNFWWMRQALADPLRDVFHTTYLFHPSGVDLALHTHTALNAFAGATLFGRVPLPAALNLAILVTCALNGFTAYLLAYRATAYRAGAVIAGIFFAASPPLVGHLYGHFNLYTAWVLVGFAYALLAAFDRPTWPRRLAAGALLAAVAYSDYYYFIYACVFLACVLIDRLLAPALVLTPRRVPQSRFDVGLLALAGLAATAALLIAWTGGMVVEIGGIGLSLTTGRNLRALSCALLLWWLWRRRRPSLSGSVAWDRVGLDARVAGFVCATGALLMMPLVAAAVDLWRGGHYVSQTYLWRSAPAGADAAALLLGNPFHGVWGASVMALYGTLGMNAFAGPLWFGLIPLVLLATRRLWAGHAGSRLWLLVTAVFFVWALGPYLQVFGIDTGLPLPQLLLRFVPIVSNARIPGHAAIVVSVGAAVLLAMASARWRLRRPAAALGLLTGLILLDFWAAPIPVVRLQAPALYHRLAQLPDGAVLELPLGIRDGFGQEGRFDPSVLYYQTIHGKPIVGGYISRLSPVVKASYYDSAVLETLLRLSAGEPARTAMMPDPRVAWDFLEDSGVAYIVVDARTATAPLRDYVQSLGPRLISEDGPHALFALD